MDGAGASDAFPVFPVLLAARWIHFAAVFVLFGSCFFWICANGTHPHARRATDFLLRAAALIAAVSGLTWIAAIIANMAGGFATILDLDILDPFFFQTQFGPVVAVRLIVLGAAVVAALAPMPAEARFWVLGGTGVALIIDQAWLGHAAEGTGLAGVAMPSVYSIHVLAAAAWVGGLPPLLFVLNELRMRSAPEALVATLKVLSAYSAMAMIAVLAILATGIANIGFHGGPASGRLFSTDYGHVLAIKLALVAIMLAFAGFNRLVAMPGLRAGEEVMPARLQLSIAIELAFGLLVIGAAALLGVTPPPH